RAADQRPLRVHGAAPVGVEQRTPRIATLLLARLLLTAAGCELGALVVRQGCDCCCQLRPLHAAHAQPSVTTARTAGTASHLGAITIAHPLAKASDLLDQRAVLVAHGAQSDSPLPQCNAAWATAGAGPKPGLTNGPTGQRANGFTSAARISGSKIQLRRAREVRDLLLQDDAGPVSADPADSAVATFVRRHVCGPGLPIAAIRRAGVAVVGRHLRVRRSRRAIARVDRAHIVVVSLDRLVR